MSTYQNIGQFIKSRREELGKTQEELAAIIETSATTISLYESGKRKPELEKLYKIADFLQTPVATMLNIEIPLADLDIALRAKNLDESQIKRVKEYIILLKYAKRAKQAEQDESEKDGKEVNK